MKRSLMSASLALVFATFALIGALSRDETEHPYTLKHVVVVLAVWMLAWGIARFEDRA